VHLALVKYSVLRLALFVASLVVLRVVGVKPSILMLVLAAGISLALSYLLLGRQREAVAQALAERISGRIDRRQAVGQSDADAEDADVDAAARAEASDPRRDRQSDSQ
jgi:hypothetical protein